MRGEGFGAGGIPPVTVRGRDPRAEPHLFLRLVASSLLLRRRRRLAAVSAVALGTGAASGLLAVFLSVGDRLSAELRRFGANLLVTAAGARLGLDATLSEADLPKIRDHFWRNNVVGFAPFLRVETEVNGRREAVIGTWTEREVGAGEARSRCGLETIASGWKVEGDWMRGPGEAMVGSSLARERGLKPGDRLRVGGRDLVVRGVVSTGGEEERGVLVDLGVAQEIAGKPGRVGRVLVSAVTTPESRLAEQLHEDDGSVGAVIRRLRTDPTKVRPEILESLNCTPYPTSIALAIERSVRGAEARPIRQATETEGAILERVRGAFLLLAAFAAAASGLGVLAAMTANVLDRRPEIGLLKALGATDGRVAALLLTEAAAIGLAGGAAGLAIGALSARAIGESVFGASLGVPASLALLTPLVALAVSLLGTAWPLREVIRVQPRVVLHQA